ncbi:MAG TPA: formate dehydrogenase subunit gamma [Candidatus Solibacter sp.]|nr:formate dehydrogenase subunit gamma [Candidatus Solibacter sp.]
MSGSEHLLPNNRVLRYSFRERLIHWTAGASYVYLLLTGLAFWSPWLFWIGVVLGGGSVSRLLHPWVGLVFTFAVILMYGAWASQMRSVPGDKAWWDAMKFYISNEDEKVPAAGRFNGGQKFLFWGFFWSGIVLLLSGIVLWYPQEFPQALRLVAIFLHPVFALATIGLFMLHVYMGTAFERGAFGSVIRGDVSREFATRHHRTWFEEIVRQESAKR